MKRSIKKSQWLLLLLVLFLGLTTVFGGNRDRTKTLKIPKKPAKKIYKKSANTLVFTGRILLRYNFGDPYYRYNGLPASGITVTFTDSFGAISSTLTDIDGKYSFSAPATCGGLYSVSTPNGGSSLRLASFGCTLGEPVFASSPPANTYFWFAPPVQQPVFRSFPTQHGKSLGCTESQFPIPANQSIKNAHGWSMDLETSQRDGLVLKNVKLNDRLLAEKMSIPYYIIQTNNYRAQGELRPRAGDQSPNGVSSRLVTFYPVYEADKLSIEATYIIDRLPNNSESCMNVTQRYEFYPPETGCEASSTLDCSRFKPIVDYQFFPQSGETLDAFNLVQRHRFIDSGIDGNAVAFFQDCDVNPVSCLITGGGPVFNKEINPIENEMAVKVIERGQKVYNTFDNIHQSFDNRVSEPGE